MGTSSRSWLRGLSSYSKLRRRSGSRAWLGYIMSDIRVLDNNLLLFNFLITIKALGYLSKFDVRRSAKLGYRPNISSSVKFASICELCEDDDDCKLTFHSDHQQQSALLLSAPSARVRAVLQRERERERERERTLTFKSVDKTST